MLWLLHSCYTLVGHINPSNSIMNQAMYEAAIAKLESMSSDDICEGMVAAGFTFTEADQTDKRWFVTIHRKTARPEEFRKSIFARCREVLKDDDWAFSSSRGVYGPESVSTVVLVVWDDAHAAVLKLAFDNETTVEVQNQ